ncbi:enhancer of polycomb homolog 2 [Odontesthes bonariensis]|uniref:enhancer of polycomb homolog 2 n=1 Tax=Odontesthes bonariensis TaxID=219752 RepID=UPI003F5898C9
MFWSPRWLMGHVLHVVGGAGIRAVRCSGPFVPLEPHRGAPPPDTGAADARTPEAGSGRDRRARAGSTSPQTMSKLSFRARALDAAKALPVYRSRELPELPDSAAISRAVPQMPTGMEKEEESEHHLQRAISAQQVFREKKENMVIPVPEAETNNIYYDRLYREEFRVPKQLIHIQPLGLDQEQPDYDMDSEDETLLNRLNRKMELRPLQFEVMVDRLENASTHQLVSLSEAKLLLNEDDYLLKSVYDYWVRKRKNWRGPSLIPQIKQERRDGSTNSDAYVAFRRRTEKMQTRKNRKNDEASYEKMLRLRREFSRSVTILEMIKRREKSKRELLHLTLEVVERRYQMADFSGDVLRELALPLVDKPVNSSSPAALNRTNRHKPETNIKKQQLSVKYELPFKLIRPKKNIRQDRLHPPQREPGRPTGSSTISQADIKQYDFHSSGEDESPAASQSASSDDDEENITDEGFFFRRTAGCQYLSPCTEQLGGDLRPRCLRHRLAELSQAPHWMGLTRRRIGRGGRIILDRASSGLDPVLRQLDSLAHPVWRGSTCLLRDQLTPDLKPSPSFRTTRTSLAEVLNNIQTLRKFCFRPRSTQNHRDEARRSTGSTQQDSRTTCCLPPQFTCGPGGITEEQYQNHQQQLVQMLQSNKTTTLPWTQGSQGSRSAESSKTLDSSSAQFAASAVVSAAALPLRHGESRSYRSSVNGVHPPGVSRLPYASSSSHQSLPSQRNQVGAVYPAHAHPARPSAPPTSTLKLATVAAHVDDVSKVSTTRDPESLLNILTETTLAMEVT